MLRPPEGAQGKGQVGAVGSHLAGVQRPDRPRGAGLGTNSAGHAHRKPAVYSEKGAGLRQRETSAAAELWPPPATQEGGLGVQEKLRIQTVFEIL